MTVANTEARIADLVDQYENCDRGFGTYSHGEQVAVAMTIGRFDLIADEYPDEAAAWDRLDLEWQLAAKRLRAARSAQS